MAERNPFTIQWSGPSQAVASADLNWKKRQNSFEKWNTMLYSFPGVYVWGGRAPIFFGQKNQRIGWVKELGIFLV